MLISRPEQIVLNAWLAIAGTAPGHSTFSSHVAIASGPNGETAWVREVKAFVDRNFAGTGGTERLVDAVIANLGLREFPAVRDTILELFQSRPNDRGGLAADVAQWLNTVIPDAGDAPLINAQAAFRVAIAAAHAHSSNVSNVLDAPIAPIEGRRNSISDAIADFANGSDVIILSNAALATANSAITNVDGVMQVDVQQVGTDPWVFDGVAPASDQVILLTGVAMNQIATTDIVGF